MALRTLVHVSRMAGVELWVVLTTLLLVVRFILDFFGPWYADRFFGNIVQIIEVLNYSMLHYTLGLMQLPSKRVNDYFQVWAVLLVTLSYSVKTGRPYTLTKQIPVFDLMSSLWSANLLRVQTALLLKIALWLIWSLNSFRIILYFSFCEKGAALNQENTRLVTDYMSYEHTLGGSSALAVDDDDASEPGKPKPFTMEWYNYLVLGEDLVLKEIQQKETTAPTRAAQWRIQLDPKHDKIITVEKIYKHQGGLLAGSGGDLLKDVCLSFALYKLLRRQFYDLPIPCKAEQRKMSRLVFEGILKDDDYDRALRITDVELSFLHDLFHSKRSSMFADGFPTMALLLSLFLVAATGYIAYPVRKIPERLDPAVRNRITDHGVLITCVIVALIAGKELLEIYLYVFSRWTKVRVICWDVRNRCSQSQYYWLVKMAMKVMFFFIPKGRWNQKISQCNIFLSEQRIIFPVRPVVWSIKLDTATRKAIFDSLKGLQKDPERLGNNFKATAFGSNKAFAAKYYTDLEADTHRILVWHIATSLCEIDLFKDAVTHTKRTRCSLRWQQSRLFLNGASADCYRTASSVSNYCAYLLTKSLLPDNGLVSIKVFREVRHEIRLSTSRCRTWQAVYDYLKKYELNIEKSLTKKGAELAMQLLESEAYKDDRAGLWRDLAEFWVGFLLHLAASTRASQHRIRLAGSGELMTHLWALLSHAGFHGTVSHGHQLLDPVQIGQIPPPIM